MRGGGARHRPGLLRQDRAAGRAARLLRRLSGRFQGRQHRQGRPQLRHDLQGLQERAGRAPVAQAAVHRVLELRPLPRDRRFRQTRGLRQRSGQRPSPRHLRGVRPGLHGRGVDLRARAELQQGRGQAQPDSRHAQAAAGLRVGARLRRAGEPGAGRTRDRHPHLLPGLYRPVPRAGLAEHHRSAPDRHALYGFPAGRADVAAAALPAEAADQARGWHVEHAVLAHPAPAPGVLQPALRGRGRIEGDGKRPDRPAALGAGGDHGPERPHRPLLRRRHVPVRHHSYPDRRLLRRAELCGLALRLPAEDTIRTRGC